MMHDSPLTILAGRTARERLDRAGWDPELFTTLVGASGGAKLLGLTHLDRYLFSDYLQRTSHPMELYGSSIGSWRHAALAAEDPLAAITTLQERYLNQAWDEDDPRGATQVVDELCEWVIDGFLSEDLIARICDHPRFTSHIVTARGRGLNGNTAGLRLGVGMGASAIGNAVTRRLLARGFQRVVFSSGDNETFAFDDFDSVHVSLTTENTRRALLASGSIPFLMSGQADIPGAPPGRYWDGGIIDYHFDFGNFRGEGLALYPHFSSTVKPGWFDKALRWRRTPATLLDRVVILAPSDVYIARLPHGKIPDRKDFNRMTRDARMAYWHRAMDASRALAETFERAINHSDPLAFVTPLPPLGNGSA